MNTLTLVTAPAVEPVTTQEAKLHLRVDQELENIYIDGLVKSAREFAEAFLNRALITQTWDLKTDSFPSSGEIELPYAPLQSVTSVTYTDSAGDSQTWATSNYSVFAPAGPKSQRGKIIRGYSLVYPITQAIQNAVTIRFVAGYGANGDSVPESIKQAIKVLVAEMYIRRDEARPTQFGSPAPMTAQRLMWPYRLVKWG